jgi:hypothetical protein
MAHFSIPSALEMIIAESREILQSLPYLISM